MLILELLLMLRLVECFYLINKMIISNRIYREKKKTGKNEKQMTQPVPTSNLPLHFFLFS